MYTILLGNSPQFSLTKLSIEPGCLQTEGQTTTKTPVVDQPIKTLAVVCHHQSTLLVRFERLGAISFLKTYSMLKSSMLCKGCILPVTR